jgi:hypothetical protein
VADDISAGVAEGLFEVATFEEVVEEAERQVTDTGQRSLLSPEPASSMDDQELVGCRCDSARRERQSDSSVGRQKRSRSTFPQPSYGTLLESGSLPPLVQLGECPSQISHHVERHSKDVFPCSSDLQRVVGCEDLSYRAA